MSRTPRGSGESPGNVDDHWIVREAGADDLDRLVEWASAMAHETEGKVLDRATLRAGIEAGLGDASRARYFIAARRMQMAGRETVDAPAATLMLTSEWSDWRNGTWWWIQSVYVAADHRRQGGYRALHGYVARLARDTDGVIGLRLYVERDNASAQSTYASLGMTDAGYRIYEQLLA